MVRDLRFDSFYKIVICRLKSYLVFAAFLICCAHSITSIVSTNGHLSLIFGQVQVER